MSHSQYLKTAIDAARAAGVLLKQNFGHQLDVHKFEAHDIKLDLDVRSQDLITGILLEAFPDHAIYGEEGLAGNQASPFQWIVDPIDGTVNFFYGIPHFCISIALRHEGKMIVGVILDPMRNELWEVTEGCPALLNGQPIHASPRVRLADAVLSVGFAKSKASINTGLPLFEKLVTKVRKCRLMGSAALDLAYVATGRLDAYIESSVNLWDVAAGMQLVAAAGGRCDLTPHPDQPDKLAIYATNGVLDLNIE